MTERVHTWYHGAPTSHSCLVPKTWVTNSIGEACVMLRLKGRKGYVAVCKDVPDDLVDIVICVDEKNHIYHAKLKQETIPTRWLVLEDVLPTLSPAIQAIFGRSRVWDMTPSRIPITTIVPQR